MDILIPLINGNQSSVTGQAKLIPNPQLPISIKVTSANPKFTNFDWNFYSTIPILFVPFLFSANILVAIIRLYRFFQ